MKNKIKGRIAKIDINDIMPVFILLAILIVFGIATKGAIFSLSNLQDLFNQSVVTLAAGLGMIFVVSMGGTDISHGSLVATICAIICICADQFGAWTVFPVAILVGVCSGLFIGICNAIFKVNSFMLTLSMLIAYRAMSNLLLRNNEYFFPSSLDFVNGMLFKVIAIVVLLVIFGYILMYTPFGNYLKAIGENEKAAIHVGINVKKVKIMAFVISGAMAGVAAIFTMARIGGTSTTTGVGLEMRALLAMYLCGVPVHGGYHTKIHKLIIGAPTVMLLEKSLVLCGFSGGYVQLIKGLILLAAVVISNNVSGDSQRWFRKKRQAAETGAGEMQM
ncbi:MAG: ABC transporter permease [Lachnospiraceae bacterium]|nr:ABC transporter permease [Lachnospiraceae bacterium]